MTQGSAYSDPLDDPVRRAEDVLLGGLGFGEEASIVSLERSQEKGYSGVGRWADSGELFEFSSDEELSVLEVWALETLWAAKITDETKEQPEKLRQAS
jgi:hypothetical protein